MCDGGRRLKRQRDKAVQTYFEIQLCTLAESVVTLPVSFHAAKGTSIGPRPGKQGTFRWLCHNDMSVCQALGRRAHVQEGS